MNDLFGKALLDYHQSPGEQQLITWTSLTEEDPVPLAYFFRNYQDMPAIEQKALALSKGKVLDIGCSDGDQLIGVVIVGRPISRHKEDGFTAEVTRCCIVDSASKGTNSFLYASAWRAWRAMGGRKIISYTLQSESGSSLRGAGWRILHEVEINKHKGWLTRPGREFQSASIEPKFCWIMEKKI